MDKAALAARRQEILQEATENVAEIDNFLDDPKNSDTRTMEEREKDMEKEFEQILAQTQLTNAEIIKRLHKDDSRGVITVAELYKREYPPENYIIDKFLPQTGFTMFSGDSGVGKSWIALEIVRAITNNDIFLDHFQIKTPNIPILIIDKENGLRRLQARMRSLGIPPTDKVYLLEFPEKFTLEDSDFLEYIQEYIKDFNIGIVIVDSFIDVLVGEENSSVDTAKVFSILRSISDKVCWVLLHHETKPVARFQVAAGNRARGSTNIKAQLDYLFSVQATKSPKVIHIEQGKARDYEMMVKFALEFTTVEGTQDMGGFTYLGEVQDEVTKIEEANNFVLNYLGLNPNKSRQEIIDYGDTNGISAASIKRSLAVLIEKKMVSSKQDPGKRNRKLFYVNEIVEVVDEEYLADQMGIDLED